MLRLIWIVVLCFGSIVFIQPLFDFATSVHEAEPLPVETRNLSSGQVAVEPMNFEKSTSLAFPVLNERQLNSLQREGAKLLENEQMKAQIPEGAKTIESLIFFETQNSLMKREFESAKSPFMSN